MTALEKAAQQALVPCWELVYPDHVPEGQRLDAHYARAEMAMAYAQDEMKGWPDGLEIIEVQRLSAPCWAAFAACGYHHDVDGEGEECYDSEEHVIRVLADAGYRPVPDQPGVMLCPAAAGCDTCGPALRTSGPPGRLIAQLDVDGGLL